MQLTTTSRSGAVGASGVGPLPGRAWWAWSYPGAQFDIDLGVFIDDALETSTADLIHLQVAAPGGNWGA